MSNQFSENEFKRPSLAICLLMDAVGCLTYIFPVVAEWGDVAWAPISSYIFFKVFSGKVAKIGSLINLVEELLPFTDFIPTFTLAYFYAGQKAKSAKL